MVEYRIIAGYTTHGTDAYRVGNDGSVWSRKQKIGNRWVLAAEWQLMSPTVHHDGYRYVTLYQDGKPRSRKVSVIVCEAFHGPKQARMIACHDNGDRTDDRADNLYWGTYRRNASDRSRHGRTMRGEGHANSKLTDAQVSELLALRGTMSQSTAGKRFGISQVHVGRIWNGVFRVQ